jgi:hypothetical protein
MAESWRAQKRERRAGLAKDRLEREGVWTIPGYDFPDREFSEYGTTGSACKSNDGYRSDSVKTGSRRPIPMKSKKSLATRYYRLKCVHPQPHTSSASACETTISVSDTGRQRRRESTSSATAGSGKMSSRCCGRQPDEQRTGK